MIDTDNRVNAPSVNLPNRRPPSIATQLAGYVQVWFAIVMLLLCVPSYANEIYDPFKNSPGQNLDSGIGHVTIANAELSKEVSELTKGLMGDGVLPGDPSSFLRFDITPADVKAGESGLQQQYLKHGRAPSFDAEPKLKKIRDGLQRAAEDAYVSLFPEGVIDRQVARKFVTVLDIKFVRHAPVVAYNQGDDGWHNDFSSFKPKRDDMTVLHVVNDINQVNLGTEYLENVNDVSDAVLNPYGNHAARNSFVKDSVIVHMNSNALGATPTPHRIPLAPAGYVPENGRFLVFTAVTINKTNPDYPKHLIARMGRYVFNEREARYFVFEVLDDSFDDVQSAEELSDEYLPKLKEQYELLDQAQKDRIIDRFVPIHLRKQFPDPIEYLRIRMVEGDLSNC